MSRVSDDFGVTAGSSGSPVSNKEIHGVSDEGLGEAKRSKVVQVQRDSKWVEVAQDKRSLKKYEVDVKSIDGKHKVLIPDKILSDATPLWEDFIVGKFLDIAPHIAKVHMVVNKISSYGNLSSKVEVYDVNATTMRFKIKNQKAREKVLKREMWNIAGIPMIVKSGLLRWKRKNRRKRRFRCGFT